MREDRTNAPPGADPNGRSLTRWVRTVMWAALIVPLMSFVLLAAWGYQKSVDDARAKVSHASALSLRQASRVFDAALTIARLADAATAGADAEIRANEREVHQRLADLSAGLGFVVNMNVWAADGSLLVRSDAYPADRTASIADRQYFVDRRRDPGTAGISEVLSGRASGRELFNLTIGRQTPDGAFNGVVAVSLSPEQFRDYYHSLSSDEPDLASFVLVRLDGTILARWPVVTPIHLTVDPSNPVMARVRSGATSGLEVVPEQAGRESRLISFRRVQGWPAYVTAGVGSASVIAGWINFTVLLFAVLLPVTIGLVWVSWVALRKIDAEQRSAAAMRHEVERRADAEKKVIEGQKLETLAQLTGGVAHDFNNLLTIVVNNLHIFGKRHPEFATERHLAAIHRAVRSGVRLTRQLLSFSRKQALRPERVDLRIWLKDTEGLLRSTLGSRTRLAYHVDPDTPCILVDVAELELALINTALNAQHAMADGGSLRITAARSVDPRDGAPMVLICVEDSGVGIPAELLTQVFEPFFTTKGAGKGSGLGLSQVAGLCEQAGGFADIDSVVGRGTTVRLHFPAQGLPADTSPPAIDPAVPDVHGRVLLVEDNPDVALVTAQVLRAAGLEVIDADGAQAALARLAADADAIDLVLSDISMPGPMDGIELALAVRAKWPSLPVILTTGYAEKTHEAVAAGLRVLAKPVTPDALLGEIQRAIRPRDQA